MENKTKKGKVALISVFDKTGIANFAKKLQALGWEIIATEGTGKELIKNRISFTPALKVSKNPNKLKDCVKTISFRIETGILFDRSDLKQVKEIEELNIKPIDIVVCNFPPLKKLVKTIKDFHVKNIDVGGPLMVRAAATNFKYVWVVVDPSDYSKVIEVLQNRKNANKFRQQLAIKAFRYTFTYDKEIVEFLKKNKIDKCLKVPKNL